MLVLCHRNICPLLQGHLKFLLSRKCHFVQVTSKHSPWTNNRKSHVVTTSIHLSVHLSPNLDVMYYQWHIFWISMKFGIGILMKSYQARVSSMNITLVAIILNSRAQMDFYLNLPFFFTDLGNFGIYKSPFIMLFSNFDFWKFIHWKPYFIYSHKSNFVHVSYIFCLMWLIFGAEGVHENLLYAYEFCADQFIGSCSSLIHVNEFLPHFPHSLSDLGEIRCKISAHNSIKHLELCDILKGKDALGKFILHHRYVWNHGKVSLVVKVKYTIMYGIFFDWYFGCCLLSQFFRPHSFR